MYVLCIGDMNPICVGTISGRSDGNMLEREIFAAQNIHMELFAVKGSYVLDYAIGDKVEPYVLFISNTVDRIIYFPLDRSRTPAHYSPPTSPAARCTPLLSSSSAPKSP